MDQKSSDVRAEDYFCTVSDLGTFSTGYQSMRPRRTFMEGARGRRARSSISITGRSESMILHCDPDSLSLDSGFASLPALNVSTGARVTTGLSRSGKGKGSFEICTTFIIRF